MLAAAAVFVFIYFTGSAGGYMTAVIIGWFSAGN